MNEELQKQIAGIAESARSAGKDVYEFAQAQAPELCREIVAWNFASGIWLSASSLIAVLLFMAITAWLYRKTKGTGNEPVLMFPVAAIIMLCVPVFNGAHDALKSKVAPRLVILEAIQGVAKGK